MWFTHIIADFSQSTAVFFFENFLRGRCPFWDNYLIILQCTVFGPFSTAVAATASASAAALSAAAASTAAAAVGCP